MIVCNWIEFKTVIDDRCLSVQYVRAGGNYHLRAIDGFFEVECVIPEDESHQDTSDFVQNYKPLGNKKPVSQVSQTLGSGSDTAIRPRGFCGSAARFNGEEQVSFIDYQITEEVRMNGAKLQILRPGEGDWVAVHIVHPVTQDILKTYCPGWVVFHGLINEIEDVDLSDPLPVGLLMRVEYHSVSSADGIPFVIMNLGSYVN